MPALRRYQWAVGAFALTVLWLFGGFCVASAWAWSVTQPFADVVEISRDASDTGSADFALYLSAYLPSKSQYGDGSYDETSTGGRFAGVSPYPLHVDEDDQLSQVVISNFTSGAIASVLVAGPDGVRQFIVMSTREALFPTYVRVAPSNAGTLPVSVFGTLPVSVGTSVSVAGTMPAQIVGVGDVDVRGLGVLVAFASLTGGVWLYGLVRRRRRV